MRNYKKYRSIVIDLFQSFLAEKIEKRQLLRGIEDIGDNLRKPRDKDKDLRFNFTKDDTLSTDIYDIKDDFYNREGKWIKDCMQIAIDNPKELQIYYS